MRPYLVAADVRLHRVAHAPPGHSSSTSPSSSSSCSSASAATSDAPPSSLPSPSSAPPRAPVDGEGRSPLEPPACGCLRLRLTAAPGCASWEPSAPAGQSCRWRFEWDVAEQTLPRRAGCAPARAGSASSAARVSAASATAKIGARRKGRWLAAFTGSSPRRSSAVGTHPSSAPSTSASALCRHWTGGEAAPAGREAGAHEKLRTGAGRRRRSPRCARRPRVRSARERRVSAGCCPCLLPSNI
jgi:hypothetical protein